MRSSILSIAAIVSAVSLSACDTAATSPAGSSPVATSSVSGDVIRLSGANASALGGGQSIKVGLNVALSGQGAYFGKAMVNGAQLAANQIKAAGGPSFEIVVKDHKSGDAQAGVQTTRELGQDGVHFALYSYIGVLGSAFQGIEQYQILSLDGGGGTQKFGQQKPYFYGTKAQPPNDIFPGVARYIQTAMPAAKKAALVIGDTGAENVKDSTEIARTALQAQGIDLADVEVVTYGGTDFSSAVTKLVAAKPDVILSAQYGADTGYFLKQLRGAGSDLPVIGADYIPDTAKTAGAAAEGFMFATDFFDASKPSNDWGKYFVDTFKEAYPGADAPDYYAANYYEDMFTIWQTVQRIVAKGGDVNDPAQILAAFESDLTFPSVYGTSGDKPHGTYSIDPTTHTVTGRDMGVYLYKDSAIKQLASFQIGGADFALSK